MKLNAFLPIALTLAAATLTGCSANFGTVSPTTSQLGTISGSAHGGRQPIVGAHIYMFQANSTAWAGPGITASAANASTSLLAYVASGAGQTYPDGNGGYYTLTGSDGSFSVSTYNNCVAGDQIYLYSVGGMPDGVTSNPNAGLLAVIGTCPNGGSLPTDLTVNMNELSTIAAAYAISGFATDATHVGAPSSTDSLAKTDITNAFANAQQIFDISSNPYSSAHSAPTATKVGSGIVPQKQINTLANILSACVNTTVGGTECSTLFSGLMSTGLTGSQATDTATEAIYMAHNLNINSIYSITGAAPNPYTPWYNTTSPADLSIVLLYPSPVVSEVVAIDAGGNVWVADYTSTGATVVEYSSLGVPVPGSPYSGGGLNLPSSIAFDSHGNVWISNYGGTSMTKIDTSTSPYTLSAVGTGGGANVAIGKSDIVWYEGYSKIFQYSNAGTLLNTYNSGTSPIGLAIDSSGDAWLADFTGNAAIVLNTNDSLITKTAAGSNGLANPYSIAIDSSGSAWFANLSASQISKFASNVSASPSSPFAISHGQNSIAVDGSSNVWVSEPAFTELGNDGTLLTPTAGYSTLSISDGAVAADGSGNVWAKVQISNTGALAELIGAATPVVTPISAGVQNNTIGSRP